MGADGLGGAQRADWLVGDVKSGFAGMAQQAGFTVAGKHVALDADDAGDVIAPVCSVELVGGIEDRDGAAFITVAADGMAVGTPVGDRGGGDCLDLTVQGRLIVLNLDDQGDVGLRGDVEVFFDSVARRA